MRVAMYYNNSDVRLEEKPIPQIGPGELLVKVLASGICGSDFMEWYRIRKAPLILGHEIAGEVVEIGKDIVRFNVGDRVFVSHHVPCNECHHCQSGNDTVCDTIRSTNFDPGGFSEFIRVPEINVKNGTFLLPDEMTYEQGAMIEPLACVLRGQRKAGFKAGQSVLVIGSGISGILHIMLAGSSGAKRIFATDISPDRLKPAIKFGADAAFLASEDIPTRIRESNNGCLADLVIVCAATPLAIKQALDSVERGGTILLFASLTDEETYPLPVFDVWKDNLTIAASYAAGPGDIVEAIELIASGRIEAERMITHRLGLSETGIGFQLATAGGNCLKVIIEPQR